MLVLKTNFPSGFFFLFSVFAKVQFNFHVIFFKKRKLPRLQNQANKKDIEGPLSTASKQIIQVLCQSSASSTELQEA